MKRLPLLFVAALCVCGVFSHAADSRSDFLELIDRPRVSLSPTIKQLPATNGLVQFHFSYASDKEQRVPGLLVKLNKSRGRRPVVIALHGTGGNKSNLLSLAYALATSGFIGVVIDGRYHGERTRTGTGAVEYNEAILRAWRGSGEHPFYYDTVWDVMRLVDYLKTRKDVDAKRIGLIGISKGGIETYVAAAVDERIAVAVPCIGVQSFRWALDNNNWEGRIRTIQSAFDKAAREADATNTDTGFVKRFYDRVVPGIYGEFDGPVMLPLIAPRPLLVINSDFDPNTPLPGVQECVAATQPAYRAVAAEDRFAVRIQEETAHKVLPESERAAIDWFVKWLKP